MFAQLFDEMLSANSFESFRAHSMDTIARLREAKQVVGDVQKNRLAAPGLDPVIAELVWSLKNDPVAQSFAAAEVNHFTEFTKSRPYDLVVLTANIRFIARTLSEKYKQFLQNRISELLDQDNRRVDFRIACGFYCSHLLNAGYSKQFISATNHASFLSKDHQRAGRTSLAKFFKVFDLKKRKYIVYTGVAHELGIYLMSLQYSVRKPDELSADIIGAIWKNEVPVGGLILEMEASALDPYKAMLRTHTIGAQPAFDNRKVKYEQLAPRIR
jgi:hypothetical protein